LLEDRVVTEQLDPVAKNLAAMLRMLADENEGQAIAAVRAIRRVSHGNETVKAKLYASAEYIEKPNGNGLSEAEMKKIFNAGYAAGVQAAESKQHGSDDFCGIDGKPTWEAVALFLQRNKNRLDPKHHEFIDDMAARTAWGHEPTERQHKYLHSLFFKLGGKIT
jgi:hypothetical protein